MSGSERGLTLLMLTDVSGGRTGANVTNVNITNAAAGEEQRLMLLTLALLMLMDVTNIANVGRGCGAKLFVDDARSKLFSFVAILLSLVLLCPEIMELLGVGLLTRYAVILGVLATLLVKWLGKHWGN